MHNGLCRTLAFVSLGLVACSSSSSDDSAAPSVGQDAGADSAATGSGGSTGSDAAVGVDAPAALPDAAQDSSSDAPAKADAAPTADAADGGSCAIEGTWKGTGTVSNGGVAVFNAGGTVSFAGGALQINSTFSLAGATVSITDISSTPSTAACPSAQVGQYTVQFSADCNTLTLTLVSDACTGRISTINGYVAARQ